MRLQRQPHVVFGNFNAYSPTCEIFVVIWRNGYHSADFRINVFSYTNSSDKFAVRRVIIEIAFAVNLWVRIRYRLTTAGSVRFGKILLLVHYFFVRRSFARKSNYAFPLYYIIHFAAVNFGYSAVCADKRPNINGIFSVVAYF